MSNGFIDFINLFTPPAEVERIREREARQATTKKLQDLITGRPPSFDPNGLFVDSPIGGTPLAGDPGVAGALPEGANRDFISELLNSRSSAISGAGINQASTALQEFQQRQLASKDTDIAAKAREALLATRRKNVAGLGELGPERRLLAETYIAGGESSKKAFERLTNSFSLGRGDLRFGPNNKIVARGRTPADVVTRNASRKDQVDKLSGITATAQSMGDLVNRFLPEGNQKEFLSAMLRSQDVGTLTKGITATQEALKRVRVSDNLDDVFNNKLSQQEQLKKAQLIPELQKAATARLTEPDRVAFNNVRTDDTGTTFGIRPGSDILEVIPSEQLFKKYRKRETVDANGNPETQLILMKPDSPDVIKSKKQLKPLPVEAQKAFGAVEDGLVSLKMMEDGLSETGIVAGRISQVQAGLGFNQRAIDFNVGRDNFLIAASKMIDGVPSDFDVRNLKKTIAEMTLPENVNKARIDYSMQLLKALYRRNIAYNRGLGTFIPSEVYEGAKKLGIDVSTIKPNTLRLKMKDLPQPPSDAEISSMETELDRLLKESDL